MKKIFAALIIITSLAFIASPAKAEQYYDRKGRFQLGAIMPGVFFGNKNIDAMMSFAVEGDYFILNNLSIGLKLEEATDFKWGDAPHSVFLTTVKAKYIFDIDENWKAYLGGGGGIALIGSSTWAGDINIPNIGGYYQIDDHMSVGLDANMHILIRSETAFAFSMGPSFRWKF
jgi:opacity protein-like surface antigen